MADLIRANLRTCPIHRPGRCAQCLLTRTPKQCPHAIACLSMRPPTVYQALGCERSWLAKRRFASLATGTSYNRVRARNTRARRALRCAAARRCPVCREGGGHGAGSEIRDDAGRFAEAFPAWYFCSGCPPSSGCRSQPKQCQPLTIAISRSGRVTFGASVRAGCDAIAARKYGSIALAMNSTTGTTTALPNCR